MGLSTPARTGLLSIKPIDSHQVLLPELEEGWIGIVKVKRDPFPGIYWVCVHRSAIAIAATLSSITSGGYTSSWVLRTTRPRRSLVKTDGHFYLSGIQELSVRA